MNPLHKIHELGQSLWYDNIQRRMLDSGVMADMIQRGEIRGVTSNPSIFQNAIGRSSDYDAALLPMAWSGWSAQQIIDRLMMEDILSAADLFLPLFNESDGGDGFVSLEVHPGLAHESEFTAKEAARLFKQAKRPNLMIKIPATKEGIPAIESCIAAGINVNVTLIFSLERYEQVMEAYLRGLESRVDAGNSIKQISSVASFFISRVDTKIDALLQNKVTGGEITSEKAQSLMGRAAVANAKLAYQKYLSVFHSDRFKRLQEKGARIQRPLWASTSTKNPAYSDVLYIDELIGPDTVNTVPAATLDAYRDHGRPEITLTNGVENAHSLIQSLEDLGISMKQVTTELEVEGVQAFVDAMNALVLTVEDRITSAKSQLGSYGSIISEKVKELEYTQTSSRMWSIDPTLWTNDPNGKEEIQRRLGWLTLPSSSANLIETANEFTDHIIKDGFTHAVLLGMGGSSLAPEVINSVFLNHAEKKRVQGLNLSILDSTDPEQVRAVEKSVPIEKTLFIVSSKSGGTAEVNAFLNYFWGKASKKLKKETGSHFIAITDPGTSLEKAAQEKGFRNVFLADPSVGGRYSALSAFGIIPAALIGVDLNAFLKSAERLMLQCTPDVPAGRNPGMVLGTILGEAALSGVDKLTILADPEGQAIGAWLEQLIAESSGKSGKGIVPIDGEPVGNPSKYGKDRIFVYLQGSGLLSEKVKNLRKSGFSVISLPIQDPYGIAAEFYRWEIATAVACAIMNVNAFDQPDVQDNKTRTINNLQNYISTHTLDEGKPVWENEQARVYGTAVPGIEKATQLSDVINSFLELAKPGDYIALNAYVPRNSIMVKRLEKVRSKIRNQSCLATTVGFGPRFLHSTGQLHKGGADNGLFIQITHDVDKDIPIPNSDYSFQVLERAQSLGDLEALQARGRRVIRVHLVGGDVGDLI